LLGAMTPAEQTGQPACQRDLHQMQDIYWSSRVSAATASSAARLSEIAFPFNRLSINGKRSVFH
jgi:hypothetical protein